MIVHLIGENIICKDYYRLIADHFPKEEHCFLVKDAESNDYRVHIPKEARSKGLPSLYPILSLDGIRSLYAAKGIVAHGLFGTYKLAFLAMQPWLLSKCNWAVWGGDLYCHEKPDKTVEDRIRETLRHFIVPKMGFVSTVLKKDYDLAQSWYGAKGRNFDISYPSSMQRPGVLSRVRERQNLNRETINVLIGNSATLSNKHFEALDMLSKYSNENIHLFLPLNYGEGDYASYADEVERYAIRLFGQEKVTAFRRLIDQEEYVEIMRKMHIAVFNNDRQQAMGNIGILMAIGAKIYLRNDTNMWEHYRDRGCIVNDCDSIPFLSFEEFSHQSDSITDKNSEIILSFLDPNVLASKWRIVFEGMTKA